ncbi:MAG: methyltransferase family protein [Methyloligellaceae bacterium]
MMDEKDTAGVIAPPPLIFLVCLLIGIGLDAIWPVPFLQAALQYGLGLAFIVLSVALIVLVLREFSRAKTDISPYKPTMAIITTGPFAYTRNPAYLSLALLFIGIAAMADGLWIWAMVIPAMAIIHFFVVLREEAYLERKFGDGYRTYKASVGRWV